MVLLLIFRSISWILSCFFESERNEPALENIRLLSRDFFGTKKRFLLKVVHNFFLNTFEARYCSEVVPSCKLFFDLKIPPVEVVSIADDC